MTRFLPLAAVLVVTLALVGCRPKTPPAPAVPATPATPVATVKAGDLLKEYSGNVLAANEKYKGKFIQVSGKVKSVSKVPAAERYILTLAGEDGGEVDLSGVQCLLDPSATSEAAKLKEGQTVSVQGTCDGQPLPTQVKMSDCKLAR